MQSWQYGKGLISIWGQLIWANKIFFSYYYLFIDQITTKSGRAARIESQGAYYIQATHLQTKFRVI